jgi:uncharacterized phage protein (TIGR01671 family)
MDAIKQEDDMRDIEFRGKVTYTGEWVYGDLLTKEIDTPKGLVGIQMDSGPSSGGFFYVDEKTVGEYTGLKDWNGAKIFEGDIVMVDAPNPGQFEVVFLVEDGCVAFLLKDREDVISCLFQSEQMQIIGNIHDAPELLGREKNEGHDA